MTDITIPEEAVEAAARETYIEWVRGCLLSDPTASIEDYQTWEQIDDDHERGHYISSATAAIRAAINAWPGMGTVIIGINAGSIILPQEKTDAEA